MKPVSICIVALGFVGCTSKTTQDPATKTAPLSTSTPASAAPSLGRSVAPSSPESGSAQSDRSKPTGPSLKEFVEYYDGATRRKLWLSEDLIAEFEPSEAGHDAILHADPGAREVEQPQRSARIWRLSGALRVDAFARKTSAAAVLLSPVLHEGPSPGLAMRALPGGVVATFPVGWDRARIDAWLTARGLRVQGDAVVAEANMYLVGTPPGLESVRIANELHESGELADAVPNFWRQNTPR